VRFGVSGKSAKFRGIPDFALKTVVYDRSGAVRSRRRPGVKRLAVSAILFALLLVPMATAGANAKFASRLYGYSLVLDGSRNAWQVSFALVAWTTGRIDPGLPAFDTFTEVQTQRAYVVGARPLSAGITLGKWTSFVASMRPSHCLAAPVGRAGNSTLSGVPARRFMFSCTDGFRVTAITALHARHGYFMFVASPTSLSGVSDQRAVVAAQQSFRFVSK
jgi:hypothetical protein